MIFGKSLIFGWNSKFMITLPLSDMLLQTLSIQNLVHLSANSFGINGFSLSSGFLSLKIEEMVFCYQNCSDPLWEKKSGDQEKVLKFEAKGREFSKFWDH